MDCPGCGANLDFIESSRVLIKQDPEKAGIIELRKGVADISLGDKKYAQVRIRVGNARAYLKGMAVYSDNIPEGYDVVFYISQEFGSDGKIRGWGIDTVKKYSRPLNIVEVDYLKAWDNWSNSLHLQSNLKERGETK